MGIFDKAPKIKSEEEINFVNEFQNELSIFYKELEQECAGKEGGLQFFKQAKSELDTKMKTSLADISDAFNNKHNDSTDTEFRETFLKQIKDDFYIHMDTEKEGVKYLI